MKNDARDRTNRRIWVVLGLVVLFVVVVRVRLLNLPLERDEGEFAYVGQLMLEGVAPYKMAYVIKLPGTAAIYALSMAIFGQTAAGIHLGLLLASVAAIVLVFLLAKRWFDSYVALVAATSYALMSLSWGVYGNAAHATQFIVPVALGGILLLYRHFKSGSLVTLFCSGLLFGFAFLLKQPGLVFGVYGSLLLLARESKARPVKKAAVLGLGMILPFAALCLIVWRAGVFSRFWYWTFTVAGGGWVSIEQDWADFVWYINWARMSGQLPLWLLAAVLSPFIFWMRAVRPVRPAFLAFCACSIVAGAAGLRFNPHYLVLTLPAAGMIIGLGVCAAFRLLKNSPSLAAASILPLAVFGVDCGYALFAARDYYFTGTLDRVTERIYATHPFREAAEVAAYINKHSAPADRIAVLGSEPEIYFLAHRRSATRHVSTYILMDERPYSRQMQEEMAREIEAASPEYIVYVDNITSWYPPFKPDNTLLDRMMHYIRTGYRRVGVAVSGPEPGPPKYYWDEEARRFTPDAKSHANFIFVYKLQKPPGGSP